MTEPCSREVVKVFDDILKGIAGEEKMKHCERLIICPTCMTRGKEDRGFRDIGEGFQVNDKTEECSDLFGESCDSDDEDRVTPSGIFSSKKFFKNPEMSKNCSVPEPGFESRRREHVASSSSRVCQVWSL